MQWRPSLVSMIVLLSIYPAASQAADPGALSFDTHGTPRVGAQVQAAPAAARWLHFDHDVSVASLPAVIVIVDPGTPLPGTATPLGSSGHSWRIITDSVTAAVDLSAALNHQPGVRSALPDLWLHRQSTAFDDPGYGGQWYLELLEMEALYDVTLGDPDVRVAVIDSAIDLDHPDLAGGWADPYDAYSDDQDPRPNAGEFCNGGSGICDDHGTAVSGIIGARANNGIDLVGLCPNCTLIPIKMLGEGGGSLGRDIAAFEHAIDADAGVINNSWGYVESIPVPVPLADVIHRAATETRGGLGSLVVFAAGNDDRTINDNELQALPDVLCVTATDRYGLPTAYTNKGASVDVAAPSATVSLSAGGGTTTTFGGTSAAAPVVAGLAGWVLSVDPSLSAADLHNLIINAAVESPQVTADENGHHPTYGYGEVSAQKLLQALLPEPEPVPPKACGCNSVATPWWLGLPALLVILRRRR